MPEILRLCDVSIVPKYNFRDIGAKGDVFHCSLVTSKRTGDRVRTFARCEVEAGPVVRRGHLTGAMEADADADVVAAIPIEAVGAGAEFRAERPFARIGTPLSWRETSADRLGVEACTGADTGGGACKELTTRKAAAAAVTAKGVAVEFEVPSNRRGVLSDGASDTDDRVRTERVWL